MNCPVPHCLSLKIVKFGFSKPIACMQGKRQQRWKCLNCLKHFSDNSSSFNHRFKKNDDGLNAKILILCLNHVSNRQIAHLNHISEHCVRIRLDRMAKRALVFHQSYLSKITIGETICFDGLENFAGSQYDPNNIHQAVGEDSLFHYDFNCVQLNRKGRMSPWQKLKNSGIEMELGRYHPRAIRTGTVNILKRLVSRAKNKALCLNSDEHFQYKRAINWDLQNAKITHRTVSSKACRNYKNILFPVNHIDLLIRNRLAAFARQTISFSKTPGRMCQKFALFIVHSNYMRTQFSKKLKTRPEAHIKSPAQMLGLTDRILKFPDIFDRYPTAEDLNTLNSEHRCFAMGEIPQEFQRSKKYLKQKSV
jgi:transposase-like protein